MRHSAHHLEKYLSKFQHRLELIRTCSSIIGSIGGLIAVLRVMGKI